MTEAIAHDHDLHALDLADVLRFTVKNSIDGHQVDLWLRKLFLSLIKSFLRDLYIDAPEFYAMFFKLN